MPRLWRKWDPAYDATEDLARVLDSLAKRENWRAALGYYRATLRLSRPPGRYAALHEHWMSPLVVPTLYLHGADDGAVFSDFTRWVEPALPSGSRAETIYEAGHFVSRRTGPTRWRD